MHGKRPACGLTAPAAHGAQAIAAARKSCPAAGAWPAGHVHDWLPSAGFESAGHGAQRRPRAAEKCPGRQGAHAALARSCPGMQRHAAMGSYEKSKPSSSVAGRIARSAAEA